MLSIALPHVSAWNSWFVSFGNSVEGYRPLRERIDAACRAVGRDPAEVERTVALFVTFDDPAGRALGARPTPEEPPIAGDPAALVPALRGFAAEGVGHVQLVLDPITLDSIAALEPTLAALDAEA
jgi:alkanesulfonate monooxygenase SsuD/methylene tetrahydromethanopterin reductase-like flavin-dependent oxidoreductase (luciferase family)